MCCHVEPVETSRYELPLMYSSISILPFHYIYTSSTTGRLSIPAFLNSICLNIHGMLHTTATILNKFYMNNTIISTTGLSYTYAKDAQTLFDINLQVNKGDIYGFLGPNG